MHLHLGVEGPLPDGTDVRLESRALLSSSSLALGTHYDSGRLFQDPYKVHTTKCINELKKPSQRLYCFNCLVAYLHDTMTAFRFILDRYIPPHSRKFPRNRSLAEPFPPLPPSTTSPKFCVRPYSCQPHYTVINRWNDTLGEQNMIAVSIPTLLDPSLAPPGHHILHAYAAGEKPLR